MQVTSYVTFCLNLMMGEETNNYNRLCFSDIILKMFYFHHRQQ